MTGLFGYGLEVGCAADMVLQDGETLAETLVNRPPRKVVVKAGRVVARDGIALAYSVEATQPTGAVALLTRGRRAGQAPKTGHMSVLLGRLGVGWGLPDRLGDRPYVLPLILQGTGEARGTASVPVQHIMGHASPVTTSRYDRCDGKTKMEAATKIHFPMVAF